MDCAVQFVLAEADLVAFNAYVNKTVPAFRRELRKAQAAAALVGLLLVLFAFGRTTLGWPWRWAVAIVVMAVAWFALPPLVRRTALRRGIRQAQAARAPVTGRLITMWLDDEGVHRSDGAMASVTAWSAVDRVEVTPDLALIFIGPAEAFVIPRSAGPQADAFAAEAQRRVAAR